MIREGTIHLQFLRAIDLIVWGGYVVFILYCAHNYSGGTY
jgi:hypothetical protein